MPKTIKNIFLVFLIVAVILGATKVLGIQKFIMKKMYPKTYAEFVVKYAEEYGVDPLLIFAVIKAESNFNKNVVSNSNAKGIMQLMDTTAEEVASNIMAEENFESDMLFDAETNIKIGTKYLSELLNKYGNYYIAVAAYNAGIGTVDKWIQTGIIKPDGSNIEQIPYKETNNYVRKIIRDYGIYENLYGSKSNG
ncbi:MAG: lytic transglycosylase domain-containing protein [Clostridia bacterium]|nr:lytic transglycosylase domain-containing protein [Clostridia bacterium]